MVGSGRPGSNTMCSGNHRAFAICDLWHAGRAAEEIKPEG